MAKTTLLVLIRGWSPSGRLPPDFVATLGERLPDSEIWVPELEMDTFSMRDAESLSQELCRKLDARVGQMPGLERIVLLGFSAGSLLARRLFCLAHGMTADGRFEAAQAKPWAALIERQVVLAGITRGWEFSSASPALVRYAYPFLAMLTRLLCLLSRPFRDNESKLLLIDQLKRGAPFVIATRIQYIGLLKRLQAASADAPNAGLRHGGLPSTVFMLGARDEFVSPADCTELGARDEFAYIELPGSTHVEALEIAAPADSDPTRAARADQRRERLLAALTEEFARLVDEPWCVPLADIDDYLDPMDLAANPEDRQAKNDQVGQAVIVLHGIRDNGFWTKRVAREIKTLGRTRGIDVRVATPSYGYFSMWDFINLGGRRKATYWFMERYADVVSHFPGAADTISFVGHSNGTYLAARALALCPAIRFERIVFAGSVVRRDFPWATFAARGQVRQVLNYIGSQDSVVAFLPGGLERLRLRLFNVGGAGAFGFEPPLEQQGADFAELRFVEGGHGAAVDEDKWREIAAYILDGEPRLPPPAARSPLCRGIFYIAPLGTLLILLVAALILLSPLLVFSWNWLAPPLNDWLEPLLLPDDACGPLLATFTRVEAALTAQMVSLILAYVVFRFLRRW